MVYSHFLLSLLLVSTEGSPLVECCAKYGTNYVDITGEKEWSMKMIAQWDTLAQKTGAKIISFCGHDSVPWDLTTFKLVEALKKKKNDDIIKVERFDEMKGGGVSGAMIETIFNGMDCKCCLLHSKM